MTEPKFRGPALPREELGYQFTGQSVVVQFIRGDRLSLCQSVYGSVCRPPPVCSSSGAPEEVRILDDRHS